MKKFILIIFCFFFLIPAQAKCKTVKIIMYELAPYLSASLKENGLVAQIITTAFQKAGYSVSYKITSWPRALNHMEKGTMDVMTNLFFTEERALTYGYPKNYLVSMLYVFYVNKNRKDIPENITPDQLRTMRIGLVKKASYSEAFDRIIPTLENIHWGMREIHMLQMLIADRLDIVPCSFYGGMHGLRVEAKGMEQKVKRIQSDLFQHKKLFPIFSKKRPDYLQLMQDFDIQMDKMKNKGTLELIYKKHNMTYLKPAQSG